MAADTPPADHSWLRPVYEEKPESLEQFAICRNCNMIRRDHVGEVEQCLFDSTTFVVLKKNPSK